MHYYYEDTLCTVIDGSRESAWFKVISGVKQGCVMSGFLFLLVVDWLMRNNQKQQYRYPMENDQ